MNRAKDTRRRVERVRRLQWGPVEQMSEARSALAGLAPQLADDCEALLAHTKHLERAQEGETDGAIELREQFGALDGESFPDFVRRLAAERDEARAIVVLRGREYGELDAELDDARQERDEALGKTEQAREALRETEQTCYGLQRELHRIARELKSARKARDEALRERNKAKDLISKASDLQSKTEINELRIAQLEKALHERGWVLE